MSRLLPLCLLLAAACADDLPPGWENAARIQVTQKECSTANPGETSATFSVEARPASGFVRFGSVSFRCKQPLDGFLRRSKDKIDLLLQPAKMDPRDVPKCTCTFDVEADVVAKGKAEWSGFVRGDNYGGVQEPKQVGETMTLEIKN